MKKRMVLSLLVLFTLISIAILVSGTGFTSTASPATLKTSKINQTINFTITNSNVTYNITQVNFTLPVGITFVSGTNSTNATGWVFSSDTSSVNWTNLSAIGLINLSSSAWFAFQVNTSLMFNTVNFTVTTVDAASAVNSSNISITVEPDAVSTYRRFGALPLTVFLNATNNYQSNITLIINQTISENITLEIFNTTSFTANYSQSNSQTVCGSIRLLIQNSTGAGVNITGWLVNGSSTSNSTNMTLIHDTSTYSMCAAGRYWINRLMIRNYTNSTENLNISVILDISISSSSGDYPYPLNLSTGIAQFAGTIPVNASTYHSYLFNATSMNYSGVTNITSVTINLTGWSSSQDIDMFLFDNSGNLKAKSINKTAAVEWLTYSYLPASAQMWEIRIYGNSTNSSGIPYLGYLIFSTLNVTNSSNQGQQISLINFTSIFGSGLNVSNTSSINLMLRNEWNLNLTNVSESKELYYVQRSGGSGSQNISFLIPNSSIASKVKVSLNWTGASNYSFNVYRPDGSLALTSMSKFIYANITNAMQEEYNETTDIGSANGYWRIDIRNNTRANENFNVTAFVYVNASKWITSNFSVNSSTLTFNTTGLPNSSHTIQYNLTVPNDTLDGKYEGYVQYKASSGATLRIPLEAVTKVGMLMINGSIGNSTVQIDENIGMNLTKVLNITINNTGSYPLTFNHTNSSGILNLSSANKNISFTYTVPSSPISAGGSGVINIAILINTTLTGDTQGLYTGWITFTTNDSYPYQNFTLKIAVNLTNLLIVSFNSITPSITTNTSSQNVTVSLALTYVNGTGIEAPGNMTAFNETNASSNFSSAWLSSSNVSGYRIPTTGTLSIFNGTNPLCGAPCSSSTLSIRLNISSGLVGGVYAVNVLANYTRFANNVSDTRIFGGYGISSTQDRYLTINNSGLYMTTNQSSFSMSGNATARFYVNITNYGPLTSNAALNTINFTESCSDYSVAGSTSNIEGNCSLGGSSSTNPYNVSVTGNSSCLIWWTISAVSSGSGSACTGNISGIGYWYNSLTASVTVTNSTTSSTTTTTTTTSTTTTNASTTTANLEFTKAETLVFVQQNSTNTTEVGVKNTGNTTQNVTFSIIDIDQSWYALNATTASLLSGKTAGFKITFSIGDVAVKDYTGQYYAIGTNKLTKNFTLRVLPAPAKQTEINDTLTLYKTDTVNLEVEINKSRAKGLNVTIAEEKLKDLKSKVEQAENYIKAGDYFSAYQLFTDIKKLIDDTKDELAKAKAVVEAGKKRLKWIFVGIGAAVVGIGALAYMFWPTKPGYHQEKGYTPKKEENLWDNLKEKWRKIRKRE